MNKINLKHISTYCALLHHNMLFLDKYNQLFIVREGIEIGFEDLYDVSEWVPKGSNETSPDILSFKLMPSGNYKIKMRFESTLDNRYCDWCFLISPDGIIQKCARF